MELPPEGLCRADDFRYNKDERFANGLEDSRMDDYSRQLKRRSMNRARERQEARRRYQAANAAEASGRRPSRETPSPLTQAKSNPSRVSRLFSRSTAIGLAALMILAALLLFAGSYVFAGRIFPNVYALGAALGDLTVEAAEAAILDAWENDVSIDLTVDGEVVMQAEPEQLGLSIDAAAMANHARAAGLSGIPFGAAIAPAAAIDYAKAQVLLLNLTEVIYVLPYEAGYQWADDELKPLAGRAGRHLNISLNLERMTQDPAGMILNRRFELQVGELLPNIMDSSPFLEEANAFLRDGVQLQGFDPYLHETKSWQIGPRTAAGWLTADTNGLAVRRDTFAAYIQNINRDLVEDSPSRYIDELFAREKLQEALNANNPNVILRIHHLPKFYTVEQKDNGHRIGRKNGIPFELISDANPAVDWSLLVIGQQIQIPSRDELIPEDPIPSKRIIVDIESQWLVAFENDRIIFSWGISSGRETAPTYPGIYQIKSHTNVAYGSSYALCSEIGTNCGQWEMYWFMDIYEIIPGLMNGFHGAVLLPNGGYLGGGGVYEPSTFGCIMSLDSNAQLLYRWAEKGTIVEILSDDYQPESELGRLALEYISTVDTSYRPTS